MNAIIEDDKGWPHQAQPGPKHLRIWNTFLQTLCTLKSNKLEIPMGPWTKRSIRKTTGCKGFVTDNGSVIRQTDTGWAQSTVVQKRRYKEMTSEIYCDRPNNREIMIPVNIKTSAMEKIQITWRDRKEEKQHNEVQNKTWDTYVRALDTWENKLLCNIHFMCTNDEFVDITQSATETITIVSDGGCIQEIGSYGWVVAHNNRIIVTGQGRAYGGPMSSHRAEAFGKLSWMVFIHRFLQFTNIKVKCGLESFCDNKSVIEQTKTTETMEECYKAMMPNYDVVNEIVMQQQKIMVQISAYKAGAHVKGHQDRNKAKKDMTLEEKLNVSADELATQVLKQMQKQDCKPEDLQLPSCNAYLMSNGTLVSSNERRTLLWQWAEFNIQQYYEEKLGVNTQELHYINWAGLKIARGRLPGNIQMFSQKYSIGWLATGSRMERMGKQVVGCPLCKEDEDNDHLLKCKGRREETMKTLDEFHLFLTSIDTYPEVQYGLTQEITKWVHDESYYEVYSNEIELAVETQKSIGWKFLPRGFVAGNWGYQQEQYLQENKKTTLGNTWSANVSEWWIKQVFSIWEKRNNAIHAPTEGATRDKAEALAQVQKLYSHEMDISETDRGIFSMPLERRLTLPWKILADWVDNTWPTVKICMIQFQQRLKEGQQDIRNYGLRQEMEIRWKTQRNQTTRTNEQNTVQCNIMEYPGRMINQIVIANNKSGATHLV
jgi:hypothetical protein